jgi:uncharacterized protein YyaL (SSP411 family)
MSRDTTREPNELIKEESTYLQQHAYNPVNWLPYSDSVFKKAKEEDKLIIISIGYSSCHWCHVMEHESFEDEAVATIMNRHFICVKVDREERPDVDQYYMDACNIMTGRGGWPLNAFTLPDGRPVYVGTYFPKNQWMGLMHELSAGFKNKKEKYIEYAEKIELGIDKLGLKAENDDAFEPSTINTSATHILSLVDMEWGGRGSAPKFPMPTNWEFLLLYGTEYKNQDALDAVEITLDKMGDGGIYDQIGGGFSRYSVDNFFKVPHFEKMLYDNAQLISLYAKGYRYYKKDRYLQILEETINFCETELKSANGLYYCAIDADSEGVEGKFYVWTKEEIEEICGEDAKYIISHYGIDGESLWEHGNNVLMIQKPIDDVAVQFGQKVEPVQEIISRAKVKLLNYRNTRVKPSLDTKVLCSWNALLLSGYVDAYKATFNLDYLESSKTLAEQILIEFYDENGDLKHLVRKNGSFIDGFLEDYSYLAQAMLSLFEITGVQKYVEIANQLMDKAITHFYDQEVNVFRPYKDTPTGKMARVDTADNVCPSPVSVAAISLYRLYRIMGNIDYRDKVKAMIDKVVGFLPDYAPYYSHWLILMQWQLSYYDITPTGFKSYEEVTDRNTTLHLSAQYIWTAENPNLPVFEGKNNEQLAYYICTEKGCGLPIKSHSQVLQDISSSVE